jgi:hypothetical protein
MEKAVLKKYCIGYAMYLFDTDANAKKKQIYHQIN